MKKEKIYQKSLILIILLLTPLSNSLLEAAFFDGNVGSYYKISDTEGGFIGTLNETDLFGSSVASLGDLDGDGVTDIAVGALEDSGLGYGSVWILFMNSNGSVKNYQEISDGIAGFDGNFLNTDHFGSSVENLGDLDGDGITDIAVGAPGSDIGGFNHGAVFILFLNSNGTVKSSQEISDNQGNFTAVLNDNATVGTDIANLGDLNYDGISDIAVSSFADSGKGAVWILFLNEDGTVQSHRKISSQLGGFNVTLDNGDRFGSSVTSMGDLDGDGVTDIAVGSIWDDDGGDNRGAVWVMFLNSNGTVKSYQKISDTAGNFIGELNNDDRFGYSLTSPGDYDGDGIADLIVGATKDDDGSSDAGAIWVLYIKSDGTVKSQKKISNAEGNFLGGLNSGDYFGHSVSAIGDFDLDGITDIVVGAINDDDGGDNKGAIWILLSKDLDQTPKYPLYTQIESPYPSLIETAQWADDVYASGRGALGEYPCGLTIGDCGCAITSLVMAARNAGIEEDVVGGDVNPGNMNTYLDSVGGYDSTGSLYWLAAQIYFGQFVGGGEIASRFSTAVERPVGDVMSFIDDSLNDAENAVLAYKNGHFVWLPEKTDDSYVVNDPWWFDTKTANDVAGNMVRDYNNTFDDARVFTIADEPAVLSGGGVEAHVRGTAELLFTKVTGEQVGYENGGVVVDLEHASYGNTNTVSLSGVSGADGKSLLVYEAGDQFTLDVVGTGFGEYEVEFFTISESGEINTFELSGQTIPGVTTTFVINLETGEVTEQQITFEQFLSILNVQLEGYSLQQQKFFTKWAEKIFADMEEKTVTQAIQSIEVYKKLLVAKKIESPVISSVLDLLSGG